MNKSLPKVSKFISIFSIVGLLAGTLFLPPQLIKVEAADSISVVFDSEGGFAISGDPILNTSNSAPGLRVLPNTDITYYLDLTNNSSSKFLLSPTVRLEYPSAGLDNTATAVCRAVVGPSGARPNDTAFDAGTPCPGVFNAGAYGYESPTIPTTETAYFRITNLVVTAATGTIETTVKADGTFAQGAGVDSTPLSSYATTTNGTLLGNLFYDNGTSVSPTNANNGIYHVGFDHIASGIVVIATDGISNYGAITDSFGDYSITVPANDITSFPTTNPYNILFDLTTDYYYTTALTLTGLRVADSDTVDIGDLGANNQVDLSISDFTITPTASSYTTTTSAVIHYAVKNNSSKDASGVTVSVPLPVGTTANGPATLSSGTSYVTEEWTIPTILAGDTASLDLPIIWGAPGSVNITAEITGMVSPALIGTTPASESNDPDSFPGTTLIEGEDDINSADITVNAEPTISGLIFQDSNNSGTNESEPGLVRTVHLYNNDVDPDTIIGTTTSNSGGAYTFDSSTNGGSVIVEGTQYHVAVVSEGSEVLTTGTPDPVLATGGTTPVEDIGYFSASAITGIAFEDVNHDGRRNTMTDNFIGGVTVQLIDSFGFAYASTTTSTIDGSYSIPDLLASTYRVRIVNPSGYTATFQNVGTNTGSDEVNDSDISETTNITDGLPVAYGQTLADVSGGFFRPGSISGNVFQDFNYNDVDDSEAGMNNVVISLVNADIGAEVGTFTTVDGSGNYQFDNLIPGNYYVHFALPETYVLVPFQSNGSGHLDDSDAHPETGNTEAISISSGTHVTDVNAGVIDNKADLHLSMGVNNNSVDVGTQVTFTLGVENQGPSTTSNVVINDTLPAGLQFVSSSGDGIYDDSAGTWTIATPLLNGQVALLQIVVAVTDPGVMLNTATVATNPHPDLDTGDNDASASVTGISLTPSLSVQKSVRLGDGAETSDDTSGPTTFPGTAVSYFIDVANTSTSALTDLTLGEVFPTVFGVTGWDCGYDVDSSSFLDHTGAYSVSCSIGTLGTVDVAKSLEPGEFLHLRLTGHVAPTTLGTYCNTIYASATGIDPSESDIACFRVVSPNADLHLTKEVDQNSVNIGDNVIYTLHVVNNGPNTSTGAIVNDSLPSGLTFVDASGDGTYSNSDGDWHVPDLLNGSGATINITATVTAAGAITNTALITDHLQPDDNTIDNTDEATVTGIAPNPSLAVLKSVQIGTDNTETTNNSSGPLVPGNEALTYYIDVANTSLATIANLSVDDDFPTGIASTGWTCSYDITTGTLNTHTGAYAIDCTVQGNGHIVLPTTLNANAVLHVRLTGHATPTSAGTYCNHVLAVAQGISTPVTDNACFQIAALTPPVLQITHGSNQTTVTPGSQVTYTITVTNNGGSPANNVVISDNLGDDVNNLVPSCVASISNVVINNNGVISTNDPTTVLWNIGTLQPGESHTVSIVTTIRSDISSATNCQTTAIASGNNVPTTQAEANISVPVQLGTALVTVNKEVIGSSTVYEPGDTIQYRVTMNNAGNGASSALKLDDALPTNIVRWQSIQSSLGTLIAGANLAVENVILPANSRNVITYTGVLKDSDTFSLKPWKLDSGADKKDNDFYAEQVVKARILGTDDADEQAAVGALDQQSVSLGQGGSIILATSKTGKVLVDGDGDDFCLAMPQSGTRYRVSVAQTNQSSSFEKLRTSSKNCFDISSSDLPWIRYIKVEDQSSTGATSVSLDAVCLLHVGGLLRNTANVLQASNTVASDAEDIAVDFTDVFDDPISASACTEPKQAQVLAPAPLPPPPAPVVIPTPVPVVLPKTGNDTLGLAMILSGLVAMFMFARRKYSLGSKK